MKNKYWLAIILIVIGFLFRLYRFGQIPESLYWDEAAIGLDARSLIETGKDLSGKSWFQPLFYSYGDYKAPVFIWLVSILGLFSGVNEVIIRLPSLIIFVLSAWVLYQLVSQFSSKRSLLPVFILFSYLIMPWSFHFSRIGMESFLSSGFLVFMIYVQFLAIKKNKWYLMVLAALFGVLSIYSYIGARGIALVLFSSGFLFFQWPNLKRNMFAFISGLLIILVSIGLLTQSPNYSVSQNYRLSNDNLIRTTEHIERSVAVRSTGPDSLLSRIANHRYYYWLQDYADNYLTHFSPEFLFFKGDSNLRHHSGFGGQLLLIQGLFLIIGLLRAVFYKKRISWLMAVWLLTGPIVSSLVNEVPHASRAVYMIIPMSWFTGLGMSYIYQRLSKIKAGKLIFTALIIALLINFFIYLHDYFRHYPERSDIAWLVPYKKAALFFKEKEPENKVFITEQWYQPGLYFAFYGQVPAALLQDSQGGYLKEWGNFNFQLPKVCPEKDWCVVPRKWRMGDSETIDAISGTDKLVIKTNKAVD